MFFMVDLRMVLFFSLKVLVVETVAGESERRGKFIAVKLKLLTAVGRLDQCLDIGDGVVLTVVPWIGGSRRATMTVFVCSVREYWPTVDLRLVGTMGRLTDFVGEEANLTD
jgi:hypothetical protein